MEAVAHNAHVDVVGSTTNDDYIFLGRQTDEVTGLPNRGYLKYKVSKILSKAGKNQNSILLLCINNFEELINTFLDPEIRTTLQKVAKILRKTFSGSDLIIRFEPDKFLIISEIEIETFRKTTIEMIQNTTNTRVDNPLDHTSGILFSFGVVSFSGNLGADILSASRIAKNN